jgi:hypothetical protein
MSPRKGGRPGAEGKTPRTRPATGKVEEEAVKANEPLPDAHDRNQHLHTTDGGTDLERQLKSTAEGGPRSARGRAKALHGESCPVCLWQAGRPTACDSPWGA